jgi:anaerobic selenocysteine-containing dehydrogenase
VIAHGASGTNHVDGNTRLCTATQVEDYPAQRVAEICQVPAEQIREAARIIGTAKRLLSTVLQGFYQSHQATAAVVQVNNVNILRGMLGKPGAGIMQMNGQPTAENTRECGADGDLPGFRNWANDSHVAELARIWNVDQRQIPHYAPPTHLMQMMRYGQGAQAAKHSELLALTKRCHPQSLRQMRWANAMLKVLLAS